MTALESVGQLDVGRRAEVDHVEPSVAGWNGAE